MTVHAFVDESRRGSQYIVAVAIAEPADLRQLRRDLRALLLPGQRELHFKREKEPRQRELIAAMSRLPIEVHLYLRSYGRREEPARQDCVERIARDLLSRDAHRLVLDSRSDRDIEDARTIRRVLGPRASESNFVYEHLDSTIEPILWIADSAAWCFQAGGHWRKRIDCMLAATLDLDCS